MDSISTFSAWYMWHVVKVLSEWRARHPLLRACPPLRADQHTHTQPAETDHERRQRAEREWMQDLID